MAGNILILEVGTQHGTRLPLTGIFFYELDPPIVDYHGAVIAPTPAKMLVASHADAIDHGLITQAELDGLDAGSLAFEVVNGSRFLFEAEEAFKARARAEYAKRKGAFLEYWRARVSLTGFRLDEEATPGGPGGPPGSPPSAP